MTDRKKPTAGFWITVALAVVLVYIGGFGPAAHFCGHGVDRFFFCGSMRIIYSPLIWIAKYGPEWLRDLFAWYVECWRFLH